MNFNSQALFVACHKNFIKNNISYNKQVFFAAKHFKCLNIYQICERKTFLKLRYSEFNNISNKNIITLIVNASFFKKI